MNRLLCIPAIALATHFAAPLGAQDQATTLLACAQQAPVVVRATVLSIVDPTPEWHRLQFRTDEVLKGEVPSGFTLLEPAGACCGRALFSLQPGDACLLFLARTGAVLHPFGGGRGVLPDDAAIVAHVRSLLVAAPGDLASVLAAALAHAELRIAADAAQALAALPALHLSATARERVRTTLLAALERGETVSAPLVEVAVRLRDGDLVRDLLPTYLTTARADQAELMARAFLRHDPALLLTTAPALAAGDPARELRAAELLARLPAADAGPTLRSMLATTSCPRVKLCAAEALLAAGARPDELSASTPAVVLELAVRRAERQRGFRSIRPHKP